MRPSNLFRKSCDNSQNCQDVCNYIVIGGGIASVLYIRRLIRNGVNKPIIMISAGANRTNTDGILRPDFPVKNVRHALNNLSTVQVEFSNSDSSGTDCGNFDDRMENSLTEGKVISQNLPFGIIGDTLGNYMTMGVGPWLTSVPGQASRRIQQLIEEFATSVSHSDVEAEWACRVSSLLNIPEISDVSSRSPGVLNHNILFLKSDSRGVIREIGLAAYERILRNSNVSVLPNSRNISFKNGTSQGLYDITIDNKTYPNSKIAWKNNIISYLSIANVGGIRTGAVSVPTPYRAVIPIPISGAGFNTSDFYNRIMSNRNNFNGFRGRERERERERRDYNHCGCEGVNNNCPCDNNYPPIFTNGINLSNIVPREDLVYAYLAMSVDNPNQNGCNNNSTTYGSPQWNIQTYITSDDLYDVSTGGRYSQPGYLLLVVDGQNITHKRNATYDFDGSQINIEYNNDRVEFEVAFEFASIVSKILYALTGVEIPPIFLLSESSVCSPNGECSTISPIVNYQTRLSSMAMFIELIQILYGSETSTVQ